MPIRLHQDDPELLREAIRFTAAETGFSARLIEKDYFCSVVLEYLAASDAGLTFKGGTCLSKIHSGFYRLSEDLDFSIPTAVDSARGHRKRSAEKLRTVIAALPKKLAGIRIVEELRGANNSTHYHGVIGFESMIDGHLEPVIIEVGLREPIMTQAQQGAAKTALLNPINQRELVDVYPVLCLSYQEAMAEKMRATLCRREVAIRDFFDVDHAVCNAALNVLESEFLDLLKGKLEIPQTGPVDVSEDRMEQLRRQLDAQLRPVLREEEFARFDLERAIEIARQVAEELARR